MLRSRGVLTVAVAIVIFFLSAHALFILPSIPDTDSYFHLAVARLFAEEGLVDKLPWPRFSVMHDAFGDKEILFHVLLIPFTYGDATTGGRLAIALQNAIIAGVIAWLAIGAIGPWGAFLAPLFYAAAPYFWIRSIRLRPEFLSLVLFLLIAWATVRRRPWIIAIFSLLLTLGHTSFHVLGALAVLWLVVTRLQEGTWEWEPLLATGGGIAAGVLLHPHFPDNVKIWFLQNATFMQMKGALDTGAETHPPQLQVYAMHNIGWCIAIVAAIVLLRPWRNRLSRETAVFGSMAIVFLVLQLMMERIATYFLPTMTLAVMYACVGLVRSRVAVIITAVIAIAAAAASTPFAIRVVSSIMAGVPADVDRDYAELSKRIPNGAKVAARWGATDAYVFWAPQGRYLNVLDPVFFAVPHPDAYWAQRRMFEGNEPDLPLVTTRMLDSDYVAVSRWETSREFLDRIAADPRLERIYDGYNVLLRVKRSANSAFVIDWQNYPLLARDVEGFVDADRVSRGAQCTTLVHSFALDAPERRSYELAAWGPSRIWIDGQLRGAATRPQLAVLGRGGVVTTNFTEGTHEIKVETCRAGERSGFYLVQRPTG